MNHASRLLFLHGFLGSARDWEQVVHGLKSPLEKHAFDLQPAADWSTGISSVASQVDANTILVGYSMGARITLATAFQRQLAGLVLASGSPGLESDADRTQRLAHDTRIAERLEQMGDSEVPEFLSDWYRQSVFESLGENQIADLIEHRRRLDRNHHAALMRTYSVANQPNLWPRIHELDGNPQRQTRVLVVAGEKDSKYVDIARRFVRLCPSASLSIVANAGHNVPREQPEKFCEIIDDFAGRVLHHRNSPLGESRSLSDGEGEAEGGKIG